MLRGAGSLFCRRCNVLLSSDEEIYAICDDCVTGFSEKKSINSKASLRASNGKKSQTSSSR